MQEEQINLDLGMRMMNAINNRDFDAFDEIMAPDFIAHQYGISQDIHGRDAYKRVLKWACEVLNMKANVEIIFAQRDRTVTRVSLSGRHIGNFLGIAPTGKAIAWSTIETYRLENGLLKERWAIDDMWSLLTQLGVSLPS